MTDPSRSIVVHPAARAGVDPGAGFLASRVGRQLVPQLEPDEDTANGYLRLTARVLVRAEERPFTTIGVFSAREGEGRTTAAVNLAICLGRTRGRRGPVLLVDGDGRKRALTRLFCGEIEDASTGGGAKLVRTQFEGVDLMTAPKAVDRMSLHNPAAWRETLEELSERYAHIVVDCPPILDAPESLILRDCLEELVLVVRTGVTPLETVQEVLANLRRTVLGVVLNGSESGRASA